MVPITIHIDLKEGVWSEVICKYGIKSLLCWPGGEQADQVIALFIHIFSSMTMKEDDDVWWAFLQAAIKD